MLNIHGYKATRVCIAVGRENCRSLFSTTNLLVQAGNILKALSHSKLLSPNLLVGRGIFYRREAYPYEKHYGQFTYLLLIYSYVPVCVAKKLEAIQNRFLWGDDEENQNFHLVKWKEVKKHPRHGGLGIRSMVELNVALHSKLLWRFCMKEDRLWRKIVTVRWGDLNWDNRDGKRSRKQHGKSL